MLKPLTRTQAEYQRAMQAFVETPGLTDGELAVVQNLLHAAQRSVEDFDGMRHVASTGRFQTVLWSAISKARAAGIGGSW